MKIMNSALGAVEVGILAQVPIYGNRKQVIANVQQCIVSRDANNAITRMLLALEGPDGFRYLDITDAGKIEQLRKGAKRLKSGTIHPAFAALLGETQDVTG